MKDILELIVALPPKRQFLIEMRLKSLLGEYEDAPPPAVVPMRKGEIPTELGWYVVEHRTCGRGCIEVYRRTGGGLVFKGYAYEIPVHDEKYTFIARIYPERISGGE